MSKRKAVFASLLSLTAVFLIVSCSSGPKAPRQGTPEWYWHAAKEQFAAGDYSKTQDHLDKVLLGDSPLKTQASAWQLVLLGGLARGYWDLAEAYNAGGVSSKSQVAVFRRMTSDLQRMSRQYAIAVAERAGPLVKNSAGTESLALDFDFPKGSAAEPTALSSIRKGNLPLESEQTTVQRQTLSRGLILQTAAVTGNGDNGAKAADLFKTTPVQVSRPVFLYGVAETLLQQAAMFDARKLNEPEKKKIMLQFAADCAAPAAESSDADLKKKAKDLQAKIEKEQKAAGKK